MNTKNLEKLINVLKEKNDGKYVRMAHYMTRVQTERATHTYRECATAFCIAGWAYKLCYEERDGQALQDYDSVFVSQGVAQDWLGLDNRTALRLFYMYPPFNLRRFDDQLTPRERLNVVIQVLRILKSAGEVRWEQAFKECGVPPAKAQVTYTM